MRPSQFAKKFLPPIAVDAIRWLKNRDADKPMHQYLQSGRVPWTPGYGLYRSQFIAQALADETLLERFRRCEPLPSDYGVGLDERCIEYPWLMAYLCDEPEILLDAGSTLNHDVILDHPVLQRKVIHILTLAPEANCFWQKSISYFFCDLRDILIRDSYYDTVACLSTLEHVGCDNTLYTRNDLDREHCPEDLVLVMEELRRVLKPGGTLLLTVPFGAYRHLGTFQQFDRKLLSRAIEAFGKACQVTTTFYRHTAEGWNLADTDDCAACEYVEWIMRPPAERPHKFPLQPDGAVAARAVACVQIVK
jgi:hypothetical protein